MTGLFPRSEFAITGKLEKMNSEAELQEQLS
jgi:hypothetical protein